MRTRAFLAAALLPFFVGLAVGCGGEDEGPDNSAFEVPASYDCGSTATLTCDAIVCTFGQVLQSLVAACGSGRPATYCSDLEICARAYYSCVMSGCPSGRTASGGSLEASALEACEQSFNQCEGTAADG